MATSTSRENRQTSTLVCCPVAAEWISRFENHELAILESMREPSRKNILAAIELDPLMTDVPREPVIAAIEANSLALVRK